MNVNYRRLLTLVSLVLAAGSLLSCNTSRKPSSTPTVPLTSAPHPCSTFEPNGDVCQEEDRGEICFFPCTGCSTIDVVVDPKASYTPICDTLLAQTGGIEVDTVARAVHLTNSYVLQRTDRNRTCPAIEIPLPAMRHTVGTQGEGWRSWSPEQEITLSVWLGSRRMGEVHLAPYAPVANQPICFSTLPTPTPTATYAGPTSTPWPPSRQLLSPLSPVGTPSP